MFGMTVLCMRSWNGVQRSKCACSDGDRVVRSGRTRYVFCTSMTSSAVVAGSITGSSGSGIVS